MGPRCPHQGYGTATTAPTDRAKGSGMTTHIHPHRAPARPLADHARHPLEHSPEVLLALAALLVVLAGPVARAFAPESAAVSMGAAVLLLAGVTLAVVAAVRLVRDRS